MSNRIYAKRRNPGWLIQFARWIGKQRRSLAEDWACTKAHCRAVVKFIREYRRCRKNGYTRKSALFYARNAL